MSKDCVYLHSMSIVIERKIEGTCVETYLKLLQK